MGRRFTLELTQHNLSLPIPSVQDSGKECSLSATQGIHDEDTSACLPHTDECFSDALQENSIGLTHRRLLKGGRIMREGAFCWVLAAISPWRLRIGTFRGPLLMIFS